MTPQSRRVLIVDRDLAFIFWLGQALVRTGHEAYPAEGVPEALRLVSRLPFAIDLVIVSESTLGGESLVRRVGAPAIAVLEEGAGARGTGQFTDICWPKPEKLDGASAMEWLEQIERILNPGSFAWRDTGASARRAV